MLFERRSNLQEDCSGADEQQTRMLVLGPEGTLPSTGCRVWHPLGGVLMLMDH